MSVESISQVLGARSYPGRGCLAARTGDGTLALVYFLTGRSPASRGRDLLVLADGDIAVRDTTGSGTPDALRHYVAGARRGAWVVVGNGAQVVPLAEALASGVPMIEAWRQHTFEPDPPVYTSRIWVVREIGGHEDCVLGVARRSSRGDGDVDRIAWLTGTITDGTGALMTTYDGTTETVHSTPAPVDVRTASGTPTDLLNEVWSALDPRLRVAAFAITPDDAHARPRSVRDGDGVTAGSRHSRFG